MPSLSIRQSGPGYVFELNVTGNLMFLTLFGIWLQSRMSLRCVTVVCDFLSTNSWHMFLSENNKLSFSFHIFACFPIFSIVNLWFNFVSVVKYMHDVFSVQNVDERAITLHLIETNIRLYLIEFARDSELNRISNWNFNWFQR